MTKLKNNADNGEPRAMMSYALMHDKKGIKIDEQYKYLDMAMNKEENDAYLIYNEKLLESNPKDEKGLCFICFAANSGDPFAMYCYGMVPIYSQDMKRKGLLECNKTNHFFK